MFRCFSSHGKEISGRRLWINNCLDAVFPSLVSSQTFKPTLVDSKCKYLVIFPDSFIIHFNRIRRKGVRDV